MVEENKDECERNPIKLFLEEALKRQMNEMMDSFTQIFGKCQQAIHLHATIILEAPPHSMYKLYFMSLYLKVKLVQILYINGKFYWKVILQPIYSVIGKILLLHYLMSPPTCQGLVGKYYERMDEEPYLFSTTPSWNSFYDDSKEHYYLFWKYEYRYIHWTTLQNQMDQDVHEWMNTFHTLHTNMGIKDSERHMNSNIVVILINIFRKK